MTRYRWDNAPTKEVHAAIWARHAAGELTIRQAKDAWERLWDDFYRRVQTRSEAELRAARKREAEKKRERDALRARNKAMKSGWTAGVAKILAEVRRRERTLGLPDPEWEMLAPPNANPLAGTRLWGDS